ncbi:hypothetical protein EYF80_018492 [Liparis tanakae]|uniref:Uncharacterized protein n=1 Tax=Liparis tanakae TaxID=230148 RepID=A0A4Z2I0G8_9TELE|nr:hypothetical protein EYF80_018492 [Liparis tanakae]
MQGLKQSEEAESRSIGKHAITQRQSKVGHTALVSPDKGLCLESNGYHVCDPGQKAQLGFELGNRRLDPAKKPSNPMTSSISFSLWAQTRLQNILLGPQHAGEANQHCIIEMEHRAALFLSQCKLTACCSLHSGEAEVFNVYFSVVNFWLSSHIWLFRLVSSQLIGSASRSDPARWSCFRHHLASVTKLALAFSEPDFYTIATFGCSAWSPPFRRHADLMAVDEADQ